MTDKDIDKHGEMFRDKDGILADQKPGVFEESRTYIKDLRRQQLIEEMLFKMDMLKVPGLVERIRDLINEEEEDYVERT